MYNSFFMNTEIAILHVYQPTRPKTMDELDSLNSWGKVTHPTHYWSGKPIPESERLKFDFAVQASFLNREYEYVAISHRAGHIRGLDEEKIKAAEQALIRKNYMVLTHNNTKSGTIERLYLDPKIIKTIEFDRLENQAIIMTTIMPMATSCKVDSQEDFFEEIKKCGLITETSFSISQNIDFYKMKAPEVA
jgi:hypothetical protein